MLAAVAQHLQLARLIAETVGAKTAHDLIHGLPGRLVLMKEVASEENHVYVPLLCRDHDLVERLPAVISTDGITFTIADMVVCGYQDADRIVGCRLSVDEDWEA